MISRRDFFAASALTGGVCLCAARAAAEDRSGECFCYPHLLPAEAYQLSDKAVVVHLDKAASLEAVNTSALIRDDARDLRILLVHADHGTYHAFSAKCTHGGALVGYDAERRRVQCVCYGHSSWSMDGALLKGPAKKPLPKYVASVEAGKLRIEL